MIWLPKTLAGQLKFVMWGKNRISALRLYGLSAGLFSSVLKFSFQLEFLIFNMSLFLSPPLPSFEWNLATALNYSSICLYKVIPKTQENSGGK